MRAIRQIPISEFRAIHLFDVWIVNQMFVIGNSIHELVKY